MEILQLPLLSLPTLLQVLTLKTDNRYWPAWELRLDPRTATWTRMPIQ